MDAHTAPIIVDVARLFARWEICAAHLAVLNAVHRTRQKALRQAREAEEQAHDALLEAINTARSCLGAREV